MMLSFIVRLILLLFIIGGMIAYIGNYVGKYIGKRRLTLFGLRPRYTATAITVISGILIAISTLAVLLIVSQDARTALLGLDQLKKEISLKSAELKTANETLTRMNLELAAKLQQQKELQANLETAKKEIALQLLTKKTLNREIAAARKGQVLFGNGEVISLSLIQAGPEKEKLTTGLDKILSADKDLLIEAENTEATAAELAEKTGVYVVKLTATRNVWRGEIVPARFELIANRLIFKSQQEISSLDIPAGLSGAQIEGQITTLLKKVHQSARENGVLPDPSGSLGSVPYAQISELARKIKSNGKKVNLKVSAAADIYSIGPLDINFRTTYK